ncbi:hypothetical protein HQ520_10160, partial [bacterium]|nr:hypothetical protein [bacterium]
RVPFVAQWPAVLPAGVKYEYPVTSRDILPTAAAAAGHPAQSNWKLDGVDLTPYLTGKKSGSPHENEALCWRLAVRPKGPDDVPWAVRMGDWKLIGVRSSSVKEGQPNRLLYNLASDPEEKDSLLEKHPDIAQRLETAYCKWEAEMAPPAWRLKPAIKREAK